MTDKVKFHLLAPWGDGCGMDILFNSVRLGYARHEARELHRELSDLIKEWDASNAKPKTAPENEGQP